MALDLSNPKEDVLSKLMTLLKKKKKTGIGNATTDVYCVTHDDNGTYRIPMALCLMLWKIKLPSYEQLPRRNIQCGIKLGVEGREHQVPTYNSMMKCLLETRSCFLSLYCGAGKTMLATYAACQFGIKTAFVTDSTIIFPQWVKVIKQFTNARVAEITSPVDVLPDADFYVMMITACGKMSPKVLSPIKLLCVDEATYFCTPTRLPAMLNFTPAYTLGLCAEVRRDDGMHCFLPYLFGKHVIRKISTKPFTVYKMNTRFKPVVKNMRWGGRLDWNAVLESLSDNKQRNELIIGICRARPYDRIIVGCKRVSQAQYIYDRLVEYGESVALLIKDMKSFPQCRILVGTYAKMGKGFDVKNLCDEWEGEVFNVAIMAIDLVKVEQFLGRIFRHQLPEIYDLVDDFSTLKKHFKDGRLPLYKERGGVIKESYV